MNEKTNKVILTLLVVGMALLIIMNINLSNRFNNYEVNLYSSQQMITNSIHDGLYSINRDISAKIDDISNTLAQEAKLSFNETTLIRDYQIASASAYVDIGFNLKEFNPDDTVTVVARGINGKTFDCIAKGTDTGRFTASIALPVQDIYALSFASAGEKSVSEGLTTLDLAEELCGRFKYEVGYGYSFYTNAPNPTTITFHPQFTNYTNGNDALSIKEIFLIAETEGKELGRWDLLPLLQDNGDSQLIDENHTRMQVQSGEIDASVNGTVIEMAVESVGDLKVRLLFTDKLGVNYEQSDIFNIMPTGVSTSGGYAFYNGESVPRFMENGDYKEGYIHFAK